MRCSFFRRLLLIPAVITGFYISLHAQEQKPEYKFEIGGMAGGAFYMGDLNKNAFFKGLNPAVGAVFPVQCQFQVGFQSQSDMGRVYPVRPTDWKMSFPTGRKVRSAGA